MAKLPGSTYATDAMMAGPRNGSTRSGPRLLPLPDSTSMAAATVARSPGASVRNGASDGISKEVTITQNVSTNCGEARRQGTEKHYWLKVFQLVTVA